MNTRKMCDITIYQAVEQMIENGAQVDLVVDRLLTFAIAQSVHQRGAFNVAAFHRSIADKVDAGVFAPFEPTAMGQVH